MPQVLHNPNCNLQTPKALMTSTKRHSFIPYISIATLPSPLILRGTPDYSIDTVSELTR